LPKSQTDERIRPLTNEVREPMNEEIKKQLQDAIEHAKSWPTKGWKVTFGVRQTEVNSLPEAMELPKEFQHRQEAVAYWLNVKGISEHVTGYLITALEAVEKGDMKTAEDKAYFAQYYEKPLEHDSNTSKPVWESIRQVNA